MYEKYFLVALGTSVFTETLVLWGLVRFFYGISRLKATPGRIIFAGVVCTCATLPYVWFILPWLLSGTLYVIAAELFAFGAEWIMLQGILKFGFRRSALASLGCNAASFGLGLLYW